MRYLLTVTAVLSCLMGCASSPKQAAKADGVTAERQALAREVNDEITVGREMAAKLLGHLRTYKGDPTVLEYVNLVGHSLAMKAGRPEIAFHFGILDAPQVNAFATPGGYIFVTKGLIAATKSESELAVILGHEIAHVNEKHMYEEIVPKRDVSAEKAVVDILSRGHSGLGRSITQIVNKGIKMLLEDGMKVEHERAADEAGMLYATAAGYDPTALEKFLRRLEAERGKHKMPKTTQTSDARLKHVRELIAKHGLESQMVADAAVLDARFHGAVSGGRKPASSAK